VGCLQGVAGVKACRIFFCPAILTRPFRWLGREPLEHIRAQSDPLFRRRHRHEVPGPEGSPAIRQRRGRQKSYRRPLATNWRHRSMEWRRAAIREERLLVPWACIGQANEAHVAARRRALGVHRGAGRCCPPSVKSRRRQVSLASGWPWAQRALARSPALRRGFGRSVPLQSGLAAARPKAPFLPLRLALAAPLSGQAGPSGRLDRPGRGLDIAEPICATPADCLVDEGGPASSGRPRSCPAPVPDRAVVRIGIAAAPRR